MKPELNFWVDLRRAYERIREEKTVEDLEKDFEYFEMELRDVRRPSDLRDFLAVLSLNRLEYDFNADDVRHAVSATKELREWYGYLRELRANLTSYDTQRAAGNVTVTPPVRMDGRNRKEVLELLTEWTAPVSIDVSDSRTVFKNKGIVLSEVLKLLKARPELLKKYIYVFASGVLYLDGDVNLPETNLALIAPVWSFVRGVNISLSGLDGERHHNETADLGEDGLPGRRGGNGGYFLGVGEMTSDELRVSTNGGDGSNGQHGADGRDGTVYKPEGFTSTDPFRCKKPITNVMNSYGEVITYYEVYREYGCGTNGSSGGAAGLGGDGGRVMLVNMKDGSVRIDSGRSGKAAKAGKGGAGGSGANWGCLFYAEGMEYGPLQRVTKEVCKFRMPSGAPGRDGWNSVGMHEPIPTRSSFFADVLREFREFAREELMKGRKDIWRMVEKLDEVDIFDNGTIVRDFLDEMNAIEDMGKIEFYQSLNRRIERAMEGPWRTDVLTYLRTLSYGKVLALKNGCGNYVIVDLDIFLEKVSDDLHTADKSKMTLRDNTAPILLQLLRGKISYVRDALDGWLRKTSKLIAEYDLSLSRKPTNLLEHIDGRNMAYLTSLTARVIQSLSDAVLVYPGEIAKNFSIADVTVNDLMIHSEAKTSAGRFTRHQSRLLMELKSLSAANWKLRLRNMKHIMKVLNNLIDPQSEVSNFPVLLDYFESTAGLVETVRENRKFAEYVADVNALDVVSDEARTIRGYLFDTLIIAQYRNALNVFRQWVFPHMYAYDSLLPKNKRLTLRDAQTAVSILRKSVREYKSTITAYDKYIREAVFSGNNSVGEYYVWYNDDIRSDLMELFAGRTISLTADVENPHMFTKSAIKFRTVRLEFQSRRRETELAALLANVQVEMRHSGYSYYYHNGRSYLQTGEGLDLRYSYQTTAGGVPVNFNMVYKKLMDNPAIFSPYTTWDVRLNAVPDGLLEFAEDVDVALIGLGSYIEVVDLE